MKTRTNIVIQNVLKRYTMFYIDTSCTHILQNVLYNVGMKIVEDPRLTATRNIALDAAVEILHEKGVMAITHATISKATEISRSTLYRHWPEIDRLRNDTFKRAATLPEAAPKTNGPLRVDLTWLLGMLKDILNEAPWGQIAPQFIAAAASDREARILLNNLMAERIAIVEAIFDAAKARGELRPDVPVLQLVEIVISVPYFRKFIAGTPLNQAWVDTHVDLICGLAENPKS